jgi:outer membrane lipoprotein-sorting protein
MTRFSSPDGFNRAVPLTRGKAPLVLGLLVCLCFSRGLAAADSKTAVPNLSAAQVVEKHAAAKGGLQAWRAVQTLSVTGKMDAGPGDSAARSARLAAAGVGASAKRTHADILSGAAKDKADQQVQLPFRLEMKRPHKSRLEIEFAGKTAVQVYDGATGWKLRPYLNRNDVEPFTALEAKSESAKADLEGPLADYAAKGTKIELAGVEPVEGHAAYKLKLTMKNGDTQNIWIDAQSFLDVKVEGTPRRMDGKMRKVFVMQRDFRSIQGLMIPFVCETAVEGYPQTHALTLETAVVNRVLDDARFTKAQMPATGVPAVSAATPVAVNK